MIGTVKRREKNEAVNVATIFRFVSLSVLFFFLVFRVYVRGVPSQISSSARLSALVLFGIAVIKTNFKVSIGNYRTERQFQKVLGLLIILFMYAGILLLFQRGYSGMTITDDFLNFILFWGMAYYGIKVIIRDADELMQILLTISIIQSVVIILGVFFPTIRLTVNSVFNSTNPWIIRRGAEHMYSLGYAYGIGCFTSSGSLTLGLGTVASLYFFNKRESNKLLLGIIFSLITVASTMLARTGLIISIICFLFILHSNMQTKSFVRLFFSIVLIGVLGYWLFFHSPFSSTLMSRFTRLDRLLTNGVYSSYFIGYTNESTSLPSLSECFFIGTGITSGTAGSGTVVNIDGGYLRSYSALGLIMAVFYYGFMIYTMIRAIKLLPVKNERRVGLYLFVLLLVGEGKEPSLLGCTFCIFFAFLLLIEQENALKASDEVQYEI